MYVLHAHAVEELVYVLHPVEELVYVLHAHTVEELSIWGGVSLLRRIYKNLSRRS